MLQSNQSHNAFTLAQLSELVGGEIKGDRNCQILGVASLQEAVSGQITFLANPVYRKYLSSTQASAVILSKKDVEYYSGNALVVADPYSAYAIIMNEFAPEETHEPGIHPSAVIGENTNIDPTCRIEAHVQIGKRVTIGPHTWIGANTVIGDDCTIGKECRLFPNVTLYARAQMGDRVVLHSGAVVGSDGFGFAYDRAKNRWIKIYHAGTVRIGNDVEIGANTTIDRGVLDDTIIEDQVKIDNLVQIAHNVHIGAFTVVAGCTGIAGSTKIGKYCRIGGAAGFSGHIEVADNITITGMSMVTHSLPEPGGVYSSGTGVMDNATWRKNVIRFRHLDEMARTIKKIVKSQDNPEDSEIE